MTAPRPKRQAQIRQASRCERFIKRSNYAFHISGAHGYGAVGRRRQTDNENYRRDRRPLGVPRQRARDESLEVTAALTGHVSRIVIATQLSGREGRAVRESPPVWSDENRNRLLWRA
jgi:hypothetical protein